MTSDKQRDANLRNALKSTGPKSDSGKAISRRNAYKHGLTAEKVITFHEDAADYETLVDCINRELKPGSQMEQEVCDRIASVMWRLRRVPMLEAGLLTLRDLEVNEIRIIKRSNDLPQVRLAEALSRDVHNGDVLSKISRYESLLVRQFEQNLALFHKLKAMRIEQENIIDETAVGGQ